MASNGRLRVLEEDMGLVPKESEPKPEEPKVEPFVPRRIVLPAIPTEEPFLYSWTATTSDNTGKSITKSDTNFKTSGQSWTVGVELSFRDRDERELDSLPESYKPTFSIDGQGNRRIGSRSNRDLNLGLSRLIDDITDGADPNDLPQYAGAVARPSYNIACPSGDW
jgi:hypothetical protein